MKDLKELRNDIDRIDQDLVRLFEERMNVVQEVGEYKKAHQIKVQDADREQKVIDEAISQLSNKEYSEALTEWMKLTMQLSRNRESAKMNQKVKELFSSKFIHVYDLQYEEGRHYYDASRRPLNDLTYNKSEDEWKKMCPDAVSCFVILETETMGERLLLSYEYRYPVNQYLLSVPAGLIDPQDREKENPLWETAKREIHEETNLTFKETDKLLTVNPLVFSTPGMSDESNALVCAVIHMDDLSSLNQNGAVGSEKFDGFALLTKEDAERLLKKGADDHEHYYPLYTWAAMMYFVSDAWKKD